MHNVAGHEHMEVSSISWETKHINVHTIPAIKQRVGPSLKSRWGGLTEAGYPDAATHARPIHPPPASLNVQCNRASVVPCSMRLAGVAMQDDRPTDLEPSCVEPSGKYAEALCTVSEKFRSYATEPEPAKP